MCLCILQKGKGGGIALLENFILDKSTMTEQEQKSNIDGVAEYAKRRKGRYRTNIKEV